MIRCLLFAELVATPQERTTKTTPGARPFLVK